MSQDPLFGYRYSNVREQRGGEGMSWWASHFADLVVGVLQGRDPAAHYTIVLECAIEFIRASSPKDNPRQWLYFIYELMRQAYDWGYEDGINEKKQK